MIPKTFIVRGVIDTDNDVVDVASVESLRINTHRITGGRRIRVA